MATISASKAGGLITLDSDDWLGGLAPDGQVGSNAIRKAVKAIGASRIQAVNPFITYGILQPGKAATQATNVAQLAGTIVAGKIVDTTYAYLLDAGGKFHQYNYSSRVITNAGSFPHTITGTTPVGQDICIYKHNQNNVQVFSAFYSYYNSANWNVGAYTGLTTLEDTFMSGGGSNAPASPLDITGADGDAVDQRTNPHPMVVGADDILYIGSGRYLHGYDGATGINGTFQARVLPLPQGFVINGLLKYQDVLLIGGNYNPSSSDFSGEALVYVWDYTDEDPKQVIPLEDNKLLAMFLWRGQPAVITDGETEGRGRNKVKIINGNAAETVASFNQASPIQNGVDASSNALLINAGGYIVQIGDQFSGGYAVHNIGIDSTVGISGWIQNIKTLGITISSGLGSTFTLSNYNQTNWNTSSAFTYPFIQPPLPPGYKARVTNVYIEYFRTFTLADLTITLEYDFGSSSQNLETNMATLAGSLLKKYTLTPTEGVFSQFSSMNIQLVWGTSATASSSPPAISRIMVEYEYIAI